VLAGAAEANVRETLAACEAYAGYGTRAVAIVAPFYYKHSPEAVFAYYREIAENSPIDVSLYNIPMFASPIDLDTVRRLAEYPRIIGIKDSSGDLAFMMRMIAAIRPNRPEFSFLAGWEAVLAPALLIGCDGGTHGTSNVLPELICKIYNLTRVGKIEEAISEQYRLLEPFDIMVSASDFPDGIRAGVELRGFRVGPGRQPQTDKHAAALNELKAALRRSLAGMGYIAD
jgi:4-hydroxy-tetrahydrodipicolinate synthase